jgi:threonine/homoserine/homoserine lactone efflux protein
MLGIGFCASRLSYRARTDNAIHSLAIGCNFRYASNAERAHSSTLRPYSLQSSRTWFVQGFVNNLLNPNGTLFYLGVFTMVITPETSASAMLLLIFTMMLVSASFWLVFVYTLDRPTIRGFIERSQQTVNRIFGVLLILIGMRMASTQR